MDTSIFYFLLTVMILSLSPGPAMMFILQQSRRNGIRMGISAVMGTELGVFIYVILIAFGIGSVFERFPNIYTSMQLIGALYLLYLAYTSWPRKNNNTSIAIKTSGRSTFVKGLFLNLTNPKIVLFFLSLIPQFVPVGSDAKTFILYGIIFNTAGTLVNLSVAVLYKSVEKLLKKIYWFDYVPPIFFIAISIYSIMALLK